MSFALHHHTDSTSQSTRSYQDVPAASSSPSGSTTEGRTLFRSGATSLHSQLPIRTPSKRGEVYAPLLAKLNAKKFEAADELTFTPRQLYLPIISALRLVARRSQEGSIALQTGPIRHLADRSTSNRPALRRHTDMPLKFNMLALLSSPLELVGASVRGAANVDGGSSTLSSSELDSYRNGRVPKVKAFAAPGTSTKSPRRTSTAGMVSMLIGSVDRTNDDEGDTNKCGQAVIGHNGVKSDECGGLWHERSVSPAILHKRQQQTDEHCRSPLPSPKSWTPVAGERPRYIRGTNPPKRREVSDPGETDASNHTDRDVVRSADNNSEV